MYCFLLQSHITIRGATAGVSGAISQSAHAWLDLAPFQDVVAWLDVREVTPNSGSGVTCNFQTSPSKEESEFVTMGSSSGITAPGIYTTIMLKDSATVPLARWLRWNLVGSGTPPWDLTFRLWIAANAPGKHRQGMAAASMANAAPMAGSTTTPTRSGPSATTSFVRTGGAGPTLTAQPFSPQTRFGAQGGPSPNRPALSVYQQGFVRPR